MVRCGGEAVKVILFADHLQYAGLQQFLADALVRIALHDGHAAFFHLRYGFLQRLQAGDISACSFALIKVLRYIFFADKLRLKNS